MSGLLAEMVAGRGKFCLSGRTCRRGDGPAAYRLACLYHQIEIVFNSAAENLRHDYCMVPKQNAQEWRAGDVDNSSLKHSRSFHAFRVPVKPEAGSR
jgi:hypothetical protein